MKTLKIAVVSLTLFTTIGVGNLGLSLPTTPIPIPHTEPVLVAKPIASTEIPKADILCLAKNIYHEARGEPLEGQIAVAQVTLNRVQSPRYHNSVCGVVYAYRQFSWTLDKSKKIKDRKAWKASVDLATAVLTKSIHLPHFPALYFHTPQVNPRWNRGKQVVARIGNHIFYS
jgi:spore germination cell wall hydrolase CwlJ-like protein